MPNFRKRGSLEPLTVFFPIILREPVSIVFPNAKVVDEFPQFLYQKYHSLNWQPAKVMFIPYYAWANRGDNQMVVWVDQDEFQSKLVKK